MDFLRTLPNDEDSTVTKLIQKGKQPCPQLPLVTNVSVCSTQTHEKHQHACSRSCACENTAKLHTEAVAAVRCMVGGAMGLSQEKRDRYLLKQNLLK